MVSYELNPKSLANVDGIKPSSFQVSLCAVTAAEELCWS